MCCFEDLLSVVGLCIDFCGPCSVFGCLFVFFFLNVVMAPFLSITLILLSILSIRRSQQRAVGKPDKTAIAIPMVIGSMLDAKRSYQDQQFLSSLSTALRATYRFLLAEFEADGGIIDGQQYWFTPYCLTLVGVVASTAGISVLSRVSVRPDTTIMKYKNPYAPRESISLFFFLITLHSSTHSTSHSVFIKEKQEQAKKKRTCPSKSS
jgi:hypothetical protein